MHCRRDRGEEWFQVMRHVNPKGTIGSQLHVGSGCQIDFCARDSRWRRGSVAKR
jgi:hypothetical protein